MLSQEGVQCLLNCYDEIIGIVKEGGPSALGMRLAGPDRNHTAACLLRIAAGASIRASETIDPDHDLIGLTKAFPDIQEQLDQKGLELLVAAGEPVPAGGPAGLGENIIAILLPLLFKWIEAWIRDKLAT